MPILTTTEKTSYDDAVTKLTGIEDGADVNTINSDNITNITAISQTTYDGLTPDSGTLYIITTPAAKIYLGTTVIYSSI